MLVTVGFVYLREPLIVAYENFSLMKDPSGALAYQYGELHFSLAYPQEYDIERAQYLFELAKRLDPSLPYVHHELARIYFLHEDYAGALTEIDVQIAEYGSKSPNSYYVRGLIEGYAGEYGASEQDYARYLTYEPHDWAGTNDYSWILLKDGKPAAAHDAISRVIAYFPDNPWLFNSDAIALSELGDKTQARSEIAEAQALVQKLSPQEWSYAYPGNDPRIASDGLAAFQKSVVQNMHTIDSNSPAYAL